MKLSNFLVLNSILALVLGLCLLFLPATGLKVFGLTPAPEINLMAQFLGVELITVGLLCWFARKVTDTMAQKAMIQAFMIASLFGLIVSLVGTLSGVMNLYGWFGGVGIFLVLAIGYSYFLFKKPDTPHA
jgi:hypothetical protein